MSVQGYQEIIEGPLAQYVAASQQIGGDVATQSRMVEKAFNVQLEYLLNASKSAPPSAAREKDLILPIGQCIWNIQEFREKSVGSRYFNHLSAISESIPALSWVAVSPAPASYVKEMKDVGQIYTNRVLKDWREKDRKHMDWVKEWIQTMTALQAFVKQHHATGLVWGGENTASSGGVCGTPPPGPPPPPAFGSDDDQGKNIAKSLKKATSDIQTHKHTTLRQGPASIKVAQSSIQLGAKAGSDIDRSAFAQIDQGEKATKSLKKATSDIQTHKHTTLRQGPASIKVAQSSIQLGAKAGSDIDRSAFAQIDKGESVTKGLKQVTSDMQTHKITTLCQGPASSKAPQSSIQFGAKAGSVIDRSALLAQIGQGENVKKGLKQVTSDMQAHKITTLCQEPASSKAPQSSIQFGAKAGSDIDRSALLAQIGQGENVKKGLKKVTSDRQTPKNTTLRQGPASSKAPQSSIQFGAKAGSVIDRSALLAQIGQGENVKKGLKKVTSDMQTHKNKTLRQERALFEAPQSSIQPGAKPPGDKAPSFVRDGKKWLIENQKDNHNLLVEGAEMNNVVYLYNCTNSTIVVKGKLNSITLDSCKKTTVVFDSLLSCIEFINCQSVQMQVIAKVPTISIEKTDGCQMYLSNESLEVEIVSSKSSEMNVLVPNPDGDYAGYPIPEQFKTTIVPGKGLNTIIFEG